MATRPRGRNVILPLLLAPLSCILAPSAQECLGRQAVIRYVDHLYERVYERWDPPPGVRPGVVEVAIRFTLARDGSVESAEPVRNEDPKLWQSALTAMQWAQPFGELPPGAECLEGTKFRATFRKDVR